MQGDWATPNGSSYLDMTAHKELEIGLLERGPAV